MMTLHPFRTPRLPGRDVGWLRPVMAVLLAMLIPALVSVFFILLGAPTIAGPPKTGEGYSMADHFAIFIACLSTSLVVSWIIVPFATVALRIAAMLGWAGWGSASVSAVLLGLPIVHFALNGDVTTENQDVLPHIVGAIVFLGLSVWAAFWTLMARRRVPSPQSASP